MISVNTDVLFCFHLAVLHMKILIPCVAVPLALFFLCGVFYIYDHKHRRRIAKYEGKLVYKHVARKYNAVHYQC